MRLVSFAILAALILTGCHKKKYDLIIRQATVYDGSGHAPVVSDVAINADTIVAVGDLSKVESFQTIEANGLALAPGFIDTHSHHDRGLDVDPDALALVSQGVTTIFVGQDGDSWFPLKKYIDHFADSPIAVNLGTYSGHNTLRDAVMGKDFKRQATPEEIKKMVELLKEDMDAGAFGLSTGLEYDPGIYSHQDEVMVLSKVLPLYKGRYISHIRSEDRYFWEALLEIIAIGKETGIPVQISHLKLAMRSLWGKADSTIQFLEDERKRGVNITADIYPYTYWSSTIRVLFPDRNFSDEKEAAFILHEVTTPEGIIFSNYGPNPEYNGKSLADAAFIEKRTPERMLIELIKRLDECDKKNGDCGSSIVATSMDEADVENLMKWEFANICSDGSSSGRHPRGFGTFPRVLSHYVKQTKTLALEQAIHKMTALSAQNLGIKKRGSIDIGYYADVVLFNPSTIKDNASIENPQALSTGIERVWVNGVEVYGKKGTTKKYPGKVILRGE